MNKFKLKGDFINNLYYLKCKRFHFLYSQNFKTKLISKTKKIIISAKMKQSLTVLKYFFKTKL